MGGAGAALAEAAMYVVNNFIATHDSGDLWALAFFITIGSTAIGFVLDIVISDRGFGMVGNGFLVMLGGVTGVVVSQMFLSVSSMPEVQRVTLFATSASAAILLFFCMIKSWLRVT
jgi:hypothetical protein